MVDLDPWAGGIDLLVGGETAPGLRWPDLALQGGRLNWSAARAACSTVPAASAATAGPRSLSGVTAGPAAGPERSATAVTAATAGLPTPPAVAAATAAMAGTPD
ncbi:conserved hypothetical protein [Mycobacterium tuberculosis]|nr:conserved hypothetical protein [Mycobacterium tuberculosis]